MPEELLPVNSEEVEALLPMAFSRVRRRDLGLWRGQPALLENSGPSGSSRLVVWSKGIYQCIVDLPVGSFLYGYGAPAWAAVNDQWIAVLGSDELSLTWWDVEHQVSGTRVPLDGIAAGYVRAIGPSSVLVLVDHGHEGGRSIVHIDHDATVRTVHHTAAMVSDLVINESRTQVAWLEWPSASMPWESAQLKMAHWTPASLTLVPTGELAGPCAQPHWIGPALYLSVEEAEWFTPIRIVNEVVERLAVEPGEFRSDWCFGRSWTASLAGGVLLGSVFRSRARYGLWSESGYLPVDDGPDYLYELISMGDDVVALASSLEEVCQLWRFDHRDLCWRSLDTRPPPTSRGGPVELRATASGVPYVWRPAVAITADDQLNSLAGLVVCIHGGPTAYASLEWDWPSELLRKSGFSVADVDYCGSSSYGRTYRQRLNGQWGVADVHDVCAVIDELCQSGAVDPRRVFVRGGSAGAMTALLSSRDPRVCGVVSINGVTDLRQLLALTHEFESGYVAQLVGTADKNDPRYDERSPIVHAATLGPRLLIMQGADDEVVPVDQARSFVAQLRNVGRDVRYVEFAGEGHSIRRPPNVERSLREELAFYGR